MSVSLNHPAMRSRDEVDISPSAIEKMSRGEFAEFALTHLRWFMETYLFIRPEGGGAPIPLLLTDHQMEMHEDFVEQYIINNDRLIATYEKHRKSYVTTYWCANIFAHTLLLPSFHGLIVVNSNDTLETVKEDIVLPFWDNIPPAGDSIKDRPFKRTPLWMGKSPDVVAFANYIVAKKPDGTPAEVETDKGGSSLRFFNANGRKGKMGAAIDMSIFTEAGDDTVDWPRITRTTAQTLPKTKKYVIVYEGTGEGQAEFLKQMAEIAQSGAPGHKYRFFCWLDDKACRLPLKKGEFVQPIDFRGEEFKRRDYDEMRRIAKEFKRRVNWECLDKNQRDYESSRLQEALKWRRERGLEKEHYNILAFNMHYPTIPEDGRMPASRIVFDPHIITEMERAFDESQKKERGRHNEKQVKYPVSYPIFDTTGSLVQNALILAPPDKEARHLVAVDSALGKEGLNPAAIMALSFYHDGTVSQDAVFNGHVDTETQAVIAFAFADLFRDTDGKMATISVECMDKYGYAVLASLKKKRSKDGEMPRLYRMATVDGEFTSDAPPGFMMTPATKRFAIQYLRPWLKNWKIRFRDTFAQLMTFVETESGRNKGEGSKPDDLVICLLQGAYIGFQWGFYRQSATMSDSPPVDRAFRTNANTPEELIKSQYAASDNETRALLASLGVISDPAFYQQIRQKERSARRKLTVKEVVERDMAQTDFPETHDYFYQVSAYD